LTSIYYWVSGNIIEDYSLAPSEAIVWQVKKLEFSLEVGASTGDLIIG
jgi:hypothetical protein